ncbi:MAG TPA: hypothetical protein VFC50_00240 [Candidatus Dormibacteraeota bacterium]|nr:hypothetical protein [Candidatus Dormibacteraeota bacterium]
MSIVGLEQGVIDRGFQFAGEPVEIERPEPEPGALFNISEEAGVYTKVLADLGMITDLDKAGEDILAGMQGLHDKLVGDRLPDDAAVIPFFAVDLADRGDAFREAESAFNGQLPNVRDLSIYRPLYDQMTPEQLNRRSFAGETAIKGWDARAMILGGERQDAPGLLFTGLSAVEQIQAYKALRDQYDLAHPNLALGAMNVMDHLLVNAGIREKNESSREQSPLLDPNTFSRTPQAGDPETGLVEASDGGSWVPNVNSVDGRVDLDRSRGDAYSDEGLRASAGPKQT